MSEPGISVVVPLLNEAESLPKLFEEIRSACEALSEPWEALFVDDGSTDGTWEALEALVTAHPEVVAVRLRRNFGKAAALAAGFERARAPVVVTLDGDGQDDPAEIPALLAELDRGYDLVSGWKRERRDPVARRVASRVFNFVTSRLTGVRLHDLNCGLKAYRAECARSLALHGELHRFTPVLAVQHGWRVSEVPVTHRPRLHGRSHYGSERFARGLFDLVTVAFLGRYQNRPLHLFGGVGLTMMLAGFGICIYLTIDKLSGASIGQRPLLFLGALLIVVGIQLGTVGLLAQMLALTRHESRGDRGDLVAQVLSAETISGGSGPGAMESSEPG
jgi:glycosyltransferase involved in cell wall biosynthesis